MLASLLIWLSSFALLHSAYSAWVARLAAKQAGTAVTLLLGSPVPREIILEALVALFFLVSGVLWSAPKLKGVTWASEMSKRSIDTEASLLSFANVRHRGTVLFRDRDDERE
ncbi:hypothetical protein JCM5296_006734 [Sporobolomyces johnsonii]